VADTSWPLTVALEEAELVDEDCDTVSWLLGWTMLRSKAATARQTFEVEENMMMDGSVVSSLWRNH